MGNHLDLTVGGESHFQWDQVFQQIGTSCFCPAPWLCQCRIATFAIDPYLTADPAYLGIVRPDHQRFDAAIGVGFGERFHRLRVLDGILGKHVYFGVEPRLGCDGA